MRLDPACPNPLPNPVAGRSTLDEVLAQNAARDPEGLALFDPALAFPGTWREVDRAVSALAAGFSDWRLTPGAAVGVQLGARSEAALTCLALWRAGLVAALLPLPWRRRETAEALHAVGAEAIVVATSGAGGRPADAACEAAVGLPALRFLGTFGGCPPDGATPLDEILAHPAEATDRHGRPADAADHVAAITFEVGATPVARSHNELVAAGLMPLLAARIGGGDRLLTTLDLAGLPGLATGFVPWLLARATASFHQVTSTDALAVTMAALDATHVSGPGRALDRLIADGVFAGAAPTTLIAAWRAPDPRAATAGSGLTGAALVDVVAFGELGLVASARTNPLRPNALRLGRQGPEGFGALIETRASADGRLSLRGPACPGGAYPAAAPSAVLGFDADGFLDTGLIGIADRAASRVTLGGRRRGVLQIGGIATAQGDAEAAFAIVGLSGAVDAQDDALLGARVRLTLTPGADAVSAEDAAAVLEEAGYGPALGPRTVVAETARRTA